MCVGGSITPISMSYGVNGNIKNKFNGSFLCYFSASDRPIFLITQEQKHGLKRHKHQKIEQGKGYNMILITPFGFRMS